MSGAKIDKVRPFDQTLSDVEGPRQGPIRAVVTSNGKIYIMNGNHRVLGAALDNKRCVEGLLYTPSTWEEFTGIRFDPKLGHNNPFIE